MTFSQAVNIHQAHLAAIGKGERDTESEILGSFGWEAPDEKAFAQDVRIVLASAEFPRELTMAVIWLNERGLSLWCVRYRPYRDGQRTLLDVQPVLPLPEAEAYQVRLRERAQREQASRESARNFTKYDVCVGVRAAREPPRATRGAAGVQ